MNLLQFLIEIPQNFVLYSLVIFSLWLWVWVWITVQIVRITKPVWSSEK